MQEYDELLELLNNRIRLIITKEKEMRQYLIIQSRMDLYSVKNALVISAQYPQATRLIDVSKVKNTQERDTTAIQIFAKAKADGREPVKYMYDVSQIKEDVEMFAKTYDNIPKLITALRVNSNVPFKIGDSEGKICNYNEEEQTIFVKPQIPLEILLIESSKELIELYYKDANVGQKDKEYLSPLTHFMFINRYKHLFDMSYQRELGLDKPIIIPHHFTHLENDEIIKLLTISKDVYSKMLDLSEKELRVKQKMNFTKEKDR